MKTFLHHLEEAPAWRKKVTEFVFHPRLFVPISSTIMKRVMGNVPRDRVRHLMDASKMKEFFKLQGKRKSISAFTNMGHTPLVSGVQTRGGVVADIDADILIDYPEDIMSQPDSNGRRWVAAQEAFSLDAPGREVIDKILSLRLELLAKYAGMDASEWNVADTRDRREINNRWSAIETTIHGWNMKSGDTSTNVKALKGQIVTQYIDGLEALMKKHNKIVASQLMQAAYDRNPDYYDDSWDELVVNNFDIKHLYIYRNHSFYSDFITAFFPREKTWVSEIETNPDVLLNINRMMMALAKKYKFTFSYHDTAGEFTRAVGDARRRGEIRGSVR
jgi:hypothetical protein